MAKIKLDKDLYQRAVQHATDKGYSSVDEFVAHVVEQALSGGEELSEEDEKQIAERLQGLGYIE